MCVATPKCLCFLGFCDIPRVFKVWVDIRWHGYNSRSESRPSYVICLENRTVSLSSADIITQLIIVPAGSRRGKRQDNRACCRHRAM
jgi:hypothetical protein